jgi:hypothetical protein
MNFHEHVGQEWKLILAPQGTSAALQLKGWALKRSGRNEQVSRKKQILV